MTSLPALSVIAVLLAICGSGGRPSRLRSAFLTVPGCSGHPKSHDGIAAHDLTACRVPWPCPAAAQCHQQRYACAAWHRRVRARACVSARGAARARPPRAF